MTSTTADFYEEVIIKSLQAAGKLLDDIHWLIVHSLKAVQVSIRAGLDLIIHFMCIFPHAHVHIALN